MNLTMDLLKTITPTFTQMGSPSADEMILTAQLQAALLNKISPDFEPVYGEPQSVRLFFTHLRPGAPGIIKMSAGEIACDLLDYANGTKGEAARYDPPHGGGARKGWKIQRILFQNEPAALVTATWVAP